MSQDVSYSMRLLIGFALGLAIAVVSSQSCLAASEPPYNQYVGPAIEHPSPPLRSGPAVWHQEYWDVKPEKFDEFVATYKRDFYSLVRKLPGYRGYLLITTLPRTGEAALPPRRIHEPIYPHGHILLEGKIKTDRAINVGAFMHQVHNVLIVHSFQTWRDLAGFKEAVAKRYADQHEGADLWGHLAQTLYPLANNYWEANFRLALRGTPPQLEPPAAGSDADGLDLEPHPVLSSNIGFDVWDVSPGNFKMFSRMYEKYTYGVMLRVPGWRGTTIITSLPRDAVEAKRTKFDEWKGPPLGGADEFYVPQRGVLLEGNIPTDISINWSLLFKKTFTVVTLYNYTQDPYEATGLPVGPGHVHGTGFSPATATTPLHDIIDDLDPGRSDDTFKFVRNHWDMASYRPVESSLTFDLP